MNAKEFRKMYLGLQYNQVNTLTPFAIDEMLEAYLKSKVEDISDEVDEKEWEDFIDNEVNKLKDGEEIKFIDLSIKYLKQQLLKLLEQ